MACVFSSRIFMPSPPLSVAAPTQAPAVRKSPYKVIRELGEGLQGRVLLAWDEHSRKHVAVKLPSAFPATATEDFNEQLLDYQVKSIMQERQAHRFVRHENVIQCLRMVPGKKHGRSYVAMVTEFASNGDLFDMIAKNGALPRPVAKFYFHQLIRGVEACHASGVVHRDIKPENILFDDNFTLKICDFGLALTSPDRAHADTMTLHEVSGTSLYLAPEVTATKSYRATPVDIWACGVVLFIILTGYPPFEQAKAGDYWYDCIMSGRMDDFWGSQPESVAPMCPHAIDLISRMLCPNPDLRITLPEILAHPWLGDVHKIDSAPVVDAMARRRQRASVDPLAL